MSHERPIEVHRYPLRRATRQLEAKVFIEDWRIDYNEHRPHSAHGELTPSEFAQAWTTRYSHSAWTTHRGLSIPPLDGHFV